MIKTKEKELWSQGKEGDSDSVMNGSSLQPIFETSAESVDEQ
jgi:hypothetical protein